MRSKATPDRHPRVVAMRRRSLALVCCCMIALGACLGAGAALLTEGRPAQLNVAAGAPDQPIVTVPVRLADVIDDRARFRQIFCALDADHGVRFSVHKTC